MTSPEPTPASNATAEPGHAPHDEGLQVVEDRMAGDAQFQAVEDAAIRCLTCREVFGADTQHADEVERLEGASDPADQSVLVPVRCPHCDAQGTLVVRYGPEASADEAELLVRLERSPSETGRD